MAESLQMQFSINIHQKLYEKNTPHGNIEVYQTSPYGVMLTFNDQILLSESDGFFYYEMMTHPALFTHPRPQSVAILGHSYGILEEVLKHPQVQKVYCITHYSQLEEAISQFFPSLLDVKSDSRVQFHLLDSNSWIKECLTETFDLIILSQPANASLHEYYQYLYSALRENGLLIHACPYSLLESDALTLLFQKIELTGFKDWQTLSFPHPSYPMGWRVAIMAMKCLTIKRIREKDVFNRNFPTRYYNFDTHKAALALPEFVREKLKKIENEDHLINEAFF